MKSKIITYVTCSLFLISKLSAQTINPCGTYEAIDWAKKNIAGYKEKIEANQMLIDQDYKSYLSKLASQKTSTSVAITYTIPVVFHVLHTNGPENVSDAACIAALAQVNSDFSKLGADVATIDPAFQSLYVDAKMVFQLAKIDPYGNCTNGIVHHYDADTEWDQTNLYFTYKYSKEIEGSWRPSRYLNIYIVKNIIAPSASISGGVVGGYTYKPGTAPSTAADAIVCRNSFLVGLEARGISHEIGHWLGLSHTWGDTNSAGISCGDDGVDDTPKTTGFFSTCPSIASLSDSCDLGKKPNVENIMDYGSCPKMFTQGQINKMRASAASNIANRDNLSSIANLDRVGITNNTVTACGPIADFYSNKTSNCNGQSILYNSTSFNGTATSYNWVFEGGTPSTSTLSSPAVLYSSAGTFSTSLTVTGPKGSSTKVRDAFIKNYWNSSPTSFPVSESFESDILSNGWTVQNFDYFSPTWKSANVGSKSTSKSFYLENSVGGNYRNQIDVLESPQYNFRNTSNIAISFDYAFALKSANSPALNPTFKFQYSTDCGGTWTDVPSTPSAVSMATSSGGATPISAPFIPWPAKWQTKTYISAAITALNNKSDVKFRFWYQNDATNGQTQNLYIDQFNISGTVGLNEKESEFNFLVYPNPTTSSTNVEFTPTLDAKAIIKIYDVMGRISEEFSFNANSGVKTIYVVNKKQNLASGIYFVSLSLNNDRIIKKLIIE
jgi:PKD repeat protein